MTYLGKLVLFVLITLTFHEIGSFRLAARSLKPHIYQSLIKAAEGKTIASDIKQKINTNDLEEKFVKPAPIYSNKAPLFRQKKIRSRDARSSDHKKILGRVMKSRPPRKRTLVKRQRMQQMAAEIAFKRDYSLENSNLRDDTLIPLVETIALAAEKRKTNYIHVMRVFPLTEVTSFMLVIEGNNKPQNQAIALAIEVFSYSSY